MTSCYDCVHYGEECTIIDDPYAVCEYYQSKSELYSKEVCEQVLTEDELDQYIDCQIEHLLLNKN